MAEELNEYVPKEDDPKYQKIMAKARKTNKRRDIQDDKYGDGKPDSAADGIIMFLRTVMIAISCGIKMENWNNVAEGQAMLEQLMDTVAKDPIHKNYFINRFVSKLNRE